MAKYERTYSDMLLSEDFSETEIKKIVAIGNAMVRAIADERFDYYFITHSKTGRRVKVYSDAKTVRWLVMNHDIYQSEHRLSTLRTLTTFIQLKDWVRPEDNYLVKFAFWEAYWLLHGTTALEASKEKHNGTT